MLALLLTASACGNGHSVAEVELGHEEWVREGAALHEELRGGIDAGGVFLKTPALYAGEREFDRIGFMFDAERTPELDVRVSMDGGRTFMDWIPANITFREEIAHNAHADVPPGATHLQARFRGVEPSSLSYLMVDPFVFQPDPVVERDEMEELGVLTQALAADSVVDVTRAEWNARATGCTAGHTPNRMTIHHTATPTNDSLSVPGRMRQMQNYHMDTNGWCDIGYHFCIGQDGKVYEARRETLQGAHVLGHNHGNAGISFIGTYTTVEPTSDMMDAGARTIRAVADEYSIPISGSYIKGHRDYDPSNECPGSALYPRLGDLIAMAADSETDEGVLLGFIYHGDDVQDLSSRISGAAVELQTGEQTLSDEDGLYRFDLAPGTYEIEASADGYTTESLERTVQAGDTAWGSIRLHPVNGEGLVQGFVFWVDDPSEYGEYVGDTSRRIAGATVTFSPGGRQATTNSNGYFDIGLPEGTYSVQASASGYEDGTRPDDVTVVAGESTWGSTHVIRPDEDDPIPAPEVDITQPSDGAVMTKSEVQVKGTVTYSEGPVSLTVSGAQVDVDDGSFETSVTLAEGDNVIQAVAEDGSGRTGQDSVTVHYEPPSLGRLQGAVYHGPSSHDLSMRIEGAVVEIDGGESTVTNDVGEYSFDVEAGTYTVEASAEGFSTEWIVREVEAGKTVWGSIRLYPPPSEDEGTVRGVVFWVDDPSEHWDYDEDASRRVSGATVTFSPGDHVATTDSSGQYEIDLPAGTYSVTASAEGYHDGTRPEDVTAMEGHSVWAAAHVLRPEEDGPVPAPSVNITDPPDGSVVEQDEIRVSGTVTHSEPLTSLTVDGEEVGSDRGYFEALVHLEEGENVIEAVAEDELGQIGEDAITIYLGLPDSGIDGFVFDGSEGQQARISGAVVSVSEADVELVTDASGAFSADLEEGVYQLGVEADGYGSYQRSITIEQGSRLSLRVGLYPRVESDEGIIQILSPVDGAELDEEEIVVSGWAAIGNLASVTVNGVEADLEAVPSFRAEISLEAGENVIEAVAQRTNGDEAGRASITVNYEKSGCGCSAASGSGSSLVWPALLIFGLLPLTRPCRASASMGD